jgi:phosphatidylglycerophosphatase A
VWDEVIAMALIAALLPGAMWKQIWAFLLFRLLDIRKPGPIGWADRNIKGAVGVMLDDLIAAAMTLFIVALWIKLL